MSARKQPEIGIREPFEFRYGPEVPIRGHRRRGDAGSIQLPHFEFFQNVRFDDGIKARQADKRMLDAYGVDITGLYDFQMTGPAGRLYVLYEGCPAIATGVSGVSLNTLDQEKQLSLGAVTYWDAAAGACLGVHDGTLYIGRDSKLYAFITVDAIYEDQSVFVAGFDQAEFLREFPGFTITTLYSAFGELFIGLAKAAGTSEIWRYDGVTYRQDKTAIDPPATMRLFRNDTLAVAFTTSGLRLRTAAGVWSLVAGAVGEADGQVQMREYRDNLYITEDGPDIWKYDGTTLAVDHSVALARINGIANAFGYLFFGYESTLSKAIIGRLDSAGAYVDVHKNITAQVVLPDYSWARLVKQLEFYRGDLVAGVESSAFGGRLFLSRQASTSGAWDLITPVDLLAPAYGAVLAFTVY